MKKKKKKKYIYIYTVNHELRQLQGCNSKEAVRWVGGRGGWDSDTDMFLLSGEGGPCFIENL